MENSEKIIREKIQLALRNGEFLASVLQQHQARDPAADQDYLEQITKTASFFRKQLQEEKLLKVLTYAPKKFWKNAKGKRYSFVDGGVSAANLPNAVPLAIRVGAYQVVCGLDSQEREDFSFPRVLLDEVYSPSGEGFLRYDDPSKVSDAGRMLLELCAAVDQASNEPPKETVFVHGPLVNPVAPYGLEGFPNLSDTMFERLFARLPENELERGFVGAYKLAVDRCFATKHSIVGVVERDSGSQQFLHAVLSRLKLGESELLKQRRNLDNYALSDTRLMSYALATGEYVGPIEIQRQGPRGKWPRDWEFTLERIPNPRVYFLMPADNARPVRVELNIAASQREAVVMEELLHICRLLPHYVFPVGLHIVDQFAKIPRWLQRSVRSQYATQLILKALQTKDPKVIRYIKKMLLSDGRDWFLRPKQ